MKKERRRTDLEREGAGASRWMEETGDHGRVPETAARYDSDMAVYLKELGQNADRIRILESNIALLKKWAAEGR